MPGIRTFIAFPASAEIQQNISSIQSELKSIRADVKWDPQDKFHITIKFLGNIEQAGIGPLSMALEHTVEPYSAFDIIYESIGVFPDIKNPRVVWVGAKPGKCLLDIQKEIEEACIRLGFPKEERAFHPHITLGRVKGKCNLVHLTEAIKTITFEPIHSRCLEVLLIKSDLRPSGSIYTILKSFPLQT